MELRRLLAVVLAVALMTGASGVALAAPPMGDADPGSEPVPLDGLATQPDNFTANVSEAQATAWDALSNRSNASWRLVETSTHEDDGYYEFEFALDADDRTGDAEVRVDGSTGDAYRVEEAVEPANEDSAENESESEGEDEDEQGDDDVTNVSVSQSEATDIARNALSDQSSGSWVLQESEFDDDGYYGIEFALDAEEFDGEAEVEVDASSGDVLKSEQEVEPLDDDAGEDENEAEDENEDEQEQEREAEKEDEDEDDDEAEDEDEEDDDEDDEDE